MLSNKFIPHFQFALYVITNKVYQQNKKQLYNICKK